MDEISSLFQRFLRSYQRNEIVFEEGNQGSEMFIIHRGSVRIVKKSRKGEVRSLTIRGPGEFFGEMALIDNSPRSAPAISEDQGTQLNVLVDAGIPSKFPILAVCSVHIRRGL